MEESKKKKNKSAKSKKGRKRSSITDWIQSVMAIVGTLFALVGLIFAWLSLTRTDINLQNQINKLDTVANQSLEHTKLLTEQLELFKDEFDFQKQQKDLSLSQRQTEIEPKLIIEFEDQNGDIVTANLINNGKIARIIKVEEKIPNDFIIDIPFQYIGEGKEKQIYFKYKNVHERDENTVLNFTIIYEDIDKKIKLKDFKFKDVENIISEKNKSQMGQG